MREIQTMQTMQSIQTNQMPVPYQGNHSYSVPESLETTEVCKEKRNPFIESNTIAVNLSDLSKDFIPVFAKDNESTISHQNFIEGIYSAINSVFPYESIANVECRVSHKICSRIPSAVGKPTSLLEDWEKTQYFERMAFNIEISSIKDTINNNELVLSIVGVRSYNNTNLYGRKSAEVFKLAIGFINRVCTNLCISSSDGLDADMKIFNIQELQQKAIRLFQQYKAKQHLDSLTLFPQMNLTESQFATLLGRTRLYHYLPKNEQKKLPVFLFGDSQLNTIAKDYYKDNHFCRSYDKHLNLWNLYNLFTNANRSQSYIDTFLNRGYNASDFVCGISSALQGDNTYRWFIE